MNDVIDPPVPHLIDDRLEALSRRMRAASGPAMQLLSLLGGQAEGLIARLPDPARQGLETATVTALETAFDAASLSRRGRMPDTGDWLTRAMTMGSGAVGGFGGLTSALAELPITTTVLLRAIQGIAAEHGLDPDSPEGRAACLQVFAAAGPLAGDDGTDLSFVTLRLTVTGATIHGLIARVAPQLSLALGQKLAAQAVPVLGAAAGAATNYIFTSYYQDMARVQFGLMQLARETGTPLEALTDRLREKLPAKAG